MFYLTPDLPQPVLRRALAAAVLAPLSATVLLPFGGTGLGQGIPALCAIAAYGTIALRWQRMLRRRRRTASDASLWLWRAALVYGAAACGLLAWQVWAPDARVLLACGIAYLAGFAGQAINAMALKIVPFLVWLHRFSRAVGKTPAPLMSDLLPPRHARRQAVCMIGAVGLLVLAALVPHDALARLAGAAVLLACGYLEWLLWRAWRTTALRLPPGAGSGSAAPAVRAS
jgi:hypothetical protein